MTLQNDGRFRSWQAEVARDPGSAAFVPLADLYRVQGRLDVARRLCVRGLERNPSNVEGHYVLGRIHRDADEPEAAYDEWDIALSLDPGHLAARRAIAFLSVERGDNAAAREHLRRALETDPDDPRLRRALAALARERVPGGYGGAYWDAAGPLLRATLADVAREGRVRHLILMDATGRIVAQHGVNEGLDLAAVASLAAGVHAASREMARMLGQGAFSQLYHGSRDRQIFVGAMMTPPGELLLVALFGEETTVGLVRALYRQTAATLPRAVWPPAQPQRDSESLESALASGLARARADSGWRGR